MVQVLLIDDEEKIYQSVYLFLEKREEEDPFAFLDEDIAPVQQSKRAFDCKIHWASSGKQGVEMVQQGGQYDLALVDMNMPPGWNGVETIRQLRIMDSALPIALVTANIATSDEMQQLMEQQRVRLFHKPYGRDELIALVTEMLDL